MANHRCGIYKITNPLGQVYIGASKNVIDRINHHKNATVKNYPNRKISKSFIEFGFNNHSIEFIDECKEDFLKQREFYWIQEFDCITKGLNMQNVINFEYKPYEYLGIPRLINPDDNKIIPNKIILNTETGIYYIGYNDFYHTYPNVKRIELRINGVRKNKTQFIAC